MKVAGLDVTEDETVMLKIEFDDMSEALDFCIDHEIKVKPNFFEDISEE